MTEILMGEGPRAVAQPKEQALKLGHHCMWCCVRAAGPDFSAGQMAIFLQVCLGTHPDPIRGLAETLQIAKPAVVRALDTLGRLEFTRRKRDETDKRNVLVQRTVKGSVYLSDFADWVLTASGEV